MIGTDGFQETFDARGTSNLKINLVPKVPLSRCAQNQLKPVGCRSMKSTRTVRFHVYHSNHPKLKVKPSYRLSDSTSPIHLQLL